MRPQESSKKNKENTEKTKAALGKIQEKIKEFADKK